MTQQKRDELRGKVDAIIDGLESEVNFEDMPEVQLSAEIKKSRRELEGLAMSAGAEYLGITIDGEFNTSIITKTINRQLDGSGLAFRDVLNKRMTKDDMRGFVVKKVNEVMPKNLKFRSLARQDLNRGVKQFLKVRLKAMAMDKAAQLTLGDDPDVLAMIEAYNDGRRETHGNKDETGNSRQADFRANHSYFWVPK